MWRQGARPTRPSHRKPLGSGRRYRGVNVIALWVAAQVAGYAR
ncbi:MAG: ArdC-like ssDNA-binding domain-containing protein, partial [Rhodoplanes sp.]